MSDSSPTATADDSIRHHSLLRYILLRIVVTPIRALAGFGQSIAVKEQVAGMPQGVTRRRIEVQSRDPGRTINVDVYETAGAGPRPVNINFHGSGFIIPSLGTDTAFCALLAKETGAVVLDSDYRKAPESPFPGAFNDAVDIFNYVKSQPASFDPSKITLSGFSAGANISAALAVHYGPLEIKSYVSFYGNPDISTTVPPPQTSEFEQGVNLPGPMRDLFYAAYMLPDQDRADLRLSPILAPIERWPKHVFITCGTADGLWEPGKRLFEKLKEGGVDVQWMSVEKAAHGFDKEKRGASEAKDAKIRSAYEAAIATLRKGY
ncbi:alpha/beta-hydrolase [Meredithblackwellia eburnea MCA 4105]